MGTITVMMLADIPFLCVFCPVEESNWHSRDAHVPKI